MATIRVLRTAKTTLARTFYLDEVATSAAGTVTVSIAREDGTVTQSGPATGPDSGQAYSYTFDGSDTLDRLVVTWSATVGGDAIVLDQDVIEVAGGFFFGLSEARDVDAVFTNTARYPTADVAEVRLETEDECERICEQAFVPRFERETLSGRPDDGVLRLRWPNLRRLRSLTINGTAWTAAQLAAAGGDRLGLVRPSASWWWFTAGDVASPGYWPYGNGNIVVEYEHGLDRPPPDLVRVVKLRWKSLMFERKSRTPLPAQSTRSTTSEQGVVTLATESRWSTGIPTVDASYARWVSPRPGFG